MTTKEYSYPDWKHDDYDDDSHYYSDATSTDPREWDIRPQDWQEDTFDPITYKDTVPLSIEREDLDAVEAARTLEEALDAYDNTYSLEAVTTGEQSPQLCAEMLLRINDKFRDDMTPEQQEAVALETIAVGQAIGHLAEIPTGKSVDRTNLKGLTEMAEIMDYAQEYAPSEIATLEKGILNVATAIDSRASQSEKFGPVSKPIREAIDKFNNLSPREKEMIKFTEIVSEIAHADLNQLPDRIYPASYESQSKAESGVATVALARTGVWTPDFDDDAKAA